MILSTSYKDHGGEYFTSIDEMFYRTTNSHYDQSKELEKIGFDNLNNSLIVFYRVDCMDCELSYNSIEKELSSINLKKYWVSTRSEYGKTLVKEHDIKNVPSILYINRHGKYVIFTPYSDSSFNGYIDKSTMTLLKMTVEASTANSKE